MCWHVVETMGGKVVGEVMEGQRRFALQARFVQGARSDLDQIRDARVADPRGRMIPLSELADVWVEEGPAQITRERAQRRVTVETNVRGRDLGSFVDDMQTVLGGQLELPPGYHLEYGGQFENLERATQRLVIVVPLSLFLIFVLLYTTFGAPRPALLIYFNIPIAATGGILALFIRGLPFSISAAVGFIALFGVAVLNGVVMLSHFQDLRKRGVPIDEAVFDGAVHRMRPVLMTALVASVGLRAHGASHGRGSRGPTSARHGRHRRLMTSTLLTLFVLPTLYLWMEGVRPQRTS